MVAVEGYVDVIAMVNAGYEAAVAPLGTALTDDQLALIWKMADEPILCFDGDGAGRRAAYRAVDIALPLVRPGKSLRFATLPEGQDPDDLWRSGGREAIDAVLSAARPLADLLWMRETEAAGFDDPRAARRARSAYWRDHRRDRRRDRAQVLSARFRRAAAATVLWSRRAAAAGTTAGTIAGAAAEQRMAWREQGSKAAAATQAG